MKKFFKKTDGFTLVELIVVIAILGILAGVGTVGYSGYIKKANMAADQQLLAAVNQAFAAACIENGEDARNVSVEGNGVELTDGAIAADALVVTDPSAKATEIVADFFKYFAGNENNKFKVAATLNYADGIFSSPELGGTVTITYGDTTFTVPQEYIDLLNKSGFLQYEGLGVDSLVGKLESVTQLATNLFGSAEGDGSGYQLLQNILVDDGFQAYAAQAVGIDTTGMEKGEIEELLFAKMEEMVGEDGDQNAFLANAAVLYASKEATAMTPNEVIDMLSVGEGEASVKQTIIGNMNGGKNSDAFAQAALAYGMFTAFAYNEEFGGEEYQNMDEFGAMNHLDDENFQRYVKSDAAKVDAAGYMAALKVINSSVDNKEAVEKLLLNGFGDSDLTDAINGALGIK